MHEPEGRRGRRRGLHLTPWELALALAVVISLASFVLTIVLALRLLLYLLSGLGPT